MHMHTHTHTQSLEGPLSPTLLSFSQPTTSLEDLLLGNTRGHQVDLRYKGSLANLDEIDTGKQKKNIKDKNKVNNDVMFSAFAVLYYSYL